jgi:formamidopyrimidine-DNA glycosylase
MPELPEIETIRTSLEPHVTGTSILSVTVQESRLRWLVQEDDLKQWAVGRRIVSLNRRAKYLLWIMDNAAAVVFHLGMSGRLGLFAADDPVEKHTHVIFNLSHGAQVRYRDPRRFGCIKVIPNLIIDQHPLFSELGPEPLSDRFDHHYFFGALQKTGRMIKCVLMDSRIVPGVGNIYANEVLFFARIHPKRGANSLTSGEVESLVLAIQSVLQRAIVKGGTTLNDFRNAHGEPGFFQMELAVYDRESQACLSCGSSIHRIVLGQRSTYFCPQCQKEG